MQDPIKLSPVYKDYLWGGTKLAERYGKQNDNSIIAESWELSTHRDGCSLISSGADAGITLREYIEKSGNSCLGLKAATLTANGDLPILIKFIDARDILSIQVHPGDEYARINEGDNGKTEMWFILEHEPDAFLYFGVDGKTSKEDLLSAVNSGCIDAVLRKVPVKKGDVFFIPAGTIHAVGKGIVMCEIQQCSNTTYRLFDFNRTDSNGCKRPLHLQKALDVAILDPVALNTGSQLVLHSDGSVKISLLRSCNYFSVYEYTVSTSVRIRGSSEAFIVLVLLDGATELCYSDGRMDCRKGETVFIPAQAKEYTINGKCNFLLVTL